MLSPHDVLDVPRTALIVYDVVNRTLRSPDPAYQERLREQRFVENWVALVGEARRCGVTVIYTTPVSRADGSDVAEVLTDLSAETGVKPLTNCIEGSDDARVIEEIAPQPSDYFFLKRRPSAFYGTGVAELLRMLRKNTIVIGGIATNRGVETSVREAFNMDLNVVVVRDCCASGNWAAHQYSLDVAMKMYARIRTADWVLSALARGS